MDLTIVFHNKKGGVIMGKMGVYICLCIMAIFVFMDLDFLIDKNIELNKKSTDLRLVYKRFGIIIASLMLIFGIFGVIASLMSK